MAQGLGAYLAQGAGLPWIWGRSDCTIWVADWCMIHFGHDPAAGLRGCYDSEVGAEALIAAGLAQTIAPLMAPLREIEAARAGDVGVIRIAGREVAAICTGEKWAFRTPRGLGEAPAKAIRMWGR
ncbi:MAG: hypothetical protein Q4G36_08175 [Paracoccus sp. (in: a-proteobacteria)]|nr:hypothetical protein [Paracoccus sp. (in: a-proteobacteria)]